MRIVIISGGVPTTTFIDALINAMAEEGFKMIVIGKKNGSYSYHKDVDVVLVPKSKLLQATFILKLLIRGRFLHVRKIYARSKSIKKFFYDLLFYLPIISAEPDRIHFQWSGHILDRSLLFELFPEKILVSLRGAHITYKPITHPELRNAYLELFPKVRKFHSVCNELAKEAAIYNAPITNVHTIYSYVKDDILNKSILPKTSLRLNIISVGRFFWVKGYEYALDALSILKKHKTDFTYELIAQGNIPDHILYQIHQLGLQDHIKVINGLPHEEVIRKIEESDVLLLPSVEEGIANVVLEAMAVGTPVISTDCGGMGEIIKNGVNGYLVNKRDCRAIADALYLFSGLDEAARFEIAKHAKQTIQQNHTSQIFRKNFAEFYNS